MASIEPAGKAKVMRPRWIVNSNAVSTENTPAMQAAAYSPMLCPTTPAGLIPDRIHKRANANSMMKIAGWASHVSVSRSLAACLD